MARIGTTLNGINSLNQEGYNLPNCPGDCHRCEIVGPRNEANERSRCLRGWKLVRAAALAFLGPPLLAVVAASISDEKSVASILGLIIGMGLSFYFLNRLSGSPEEAK
ncbi:MAG: hypothetical protein KC994_26270 [Candidatus Omnitrophica bacterium]|nr:hypothetical protein [Candidatus Omnitrophota bacterium]MCA9436083.1 hypothetical protein [Candidatus Omnitrophota bacterium]